MDRTQAAVLWGAVAISLSLPGCTPPSNASVPVTANAQPSASTSPVPATPPTPEPDPAQARIAAFTARARQLQSLNGRALAAELSTFEQTADPVTYAMLKRNADRFRGRNAVFSGRVLEIQDTPDGGAFLRLGMGEYGENVLAVVAAVQPSESVVERSRVRVYGTLAGSYTYRSQAGWTITIPSLLAVAVVTRD